MKDRFRRSLFAERIANTLARRRDPTSTVVLINGKWGEGKTTLLEYVDKELQKYNNVLPIWFNPWRFSDETSLLLSFFATVAAALDKSPKTKKGKLGEVVRDYGKSTSIVSVSTSSGPVDSVENRGHPGFSKRVFGYVFLLGSQIILSISAHLLDNTHLRVRG